MSAKFQTYEQRLQKHTCEQENGEVNNTSQN